MMSATPSIAPPLNFTMASQANKQPPAKTNLIANLDDLEEY